MRELDGIEANLSHLFPHNYLNKITMKFNPCKQFDHTHVSMYYTMLLFVNVTKTNSNSYVSHWESNRIDSRSNFVISIPLTALVPISSTCNIYEMYIIYLHKMYFYIHCYLPKVIFYEKSELIFDFRSKTWSSNHMKEITFWNTR